MVSWRFSKGKKKKGDEESPLPPDKERIGKEPAPASRARLPPVGEPAVPPEPLLPPASSSGEPARPSRVPTGPGTPATPEKPKSDFSEFDNPVYRHEFLKSATNAQMKELCEEFMAGNWYVFGSWAALLQADKVTSFNRDCPHAVFWSALILESKPAEYQGFVGFLLRAGMADTGIRYRALRELPESCSPYCANWLLEYLSAFEHPVHTTDPKKALGHRLVYYSHYPDERLMRVAAACLKEKAIPHLERFMGVQRRFHKLHTDYSTDLEELDGLFIECVRALLDLGADPKFKPRIQGVLEEQLKKCVERNKHVLNRLFAGGDDPKSETIMLEHYHDNQGMAPASQDIGQGMLPDSLSSGRGPLSKYQWLELALSALKGDAAAKKKFLDRQEVLPGAEWLIPVDDGAGHLQGDRLFYMAHFLFDGHNHLPTLSSIHVPTGKTRYMLNLGDRSSNRGLRIWGGALALNASGEPVLATQLDFEDDSRKRMYRLVVFDKESGQVKESLPLAFEPSKEPSELKCAGEGYLMRTESTLWKMDTKGKLLWKLTMGKHGAYGFDEHSLILFRENEVELIGLDDLKTIFRKTLAELAKEAGGGFQPGARLRKGGFYLFDNNRTIYSFDGKGKFLWKLTPNPDDAWLGLPKLWGEGLSFVNFKRFCLVSPDGKLAHEFPTPERPREYLVDGNDVLYFTDGALWHWAPGIKEAKKAIAEPINHMAKPLGISGGRLLLLFYKDHYYLASVPVKNL